MKFEIYRPSGRVTFDSLVDLNLITKDDLFEILHTSLQLKISESVGEVDSSLAKTHVALITNQRLGLSQLTFRIAIDKVSGHPMTIPIGGSNIDEFLSGKESVAVLSKLGIDAFVVDTSISEDAAKLSKQLSPVINANYLSSPIIALSDVLTVYEAKRKLDGLNVVCLSKASAEASALNAFLLCGMKVTVCSPYETGLYALKEKYGEESVGYTSDLSSVIKNCDVLYVDNDFGEDYKLSEEDLLVLPSDAVILHTCFIESSNDADKAVINDKRYLSTDAYANKAYVLASVLKLVLTDNL